MEGVNWDVGGSSTPLLRLVVAAAHVRLCRQTEHGSSCLLTKPPSGMR